MTMIILGFTESKEQKPEHMECCLCFDKFEKGFRCYVYDDIDKCWCTQVTTEHDSNSDNHVCDYADNRITLWASFPKDGQEYTITLFKDVFRGLFNKIEQTYGRCESVYIGHKNTEAYDDFGQLISDDVSCSIEF